MTVQPEAVTSEMPVVMPLSKAMANDPLGPPLSMQEHRPFDPSKFLLVVDEKGIRQLCLCCHRLTPDASMDLGQQNRWAESHWMGKHT